MKKLLLILLCLPMIGFGQQTYVPDDNFEAYLEANGMGNGISNDDYVTTSNISAIPGLLYIAGQNITDLTGIEDFTDLEILNCENNQLISLDISNNINLNFLVCRNNNLHTLDLRNGNNNQFDSVWTSGNPNLTCISVDDSIYSTNNWTVSIFSFPVIDAQHYFSTNCTPMNLGCTDSLACNYDSIATIDDSSCVYSYTSTNIVTACDSYSWFNASGDTIYTALNSNVLSGGGNGVYSVNGLYIDTVIYTNQGGCDSIVILNLFLTISTYSYDTISFLDSIIWNNLLVFTSGTYYSILINSGGCDSTAYLYAISSTTGISDIANSKSNLVKITNMLGQETPQRRNTPLFYIYDDGTVEKRIVIEQ